MRRYSEEGRKRALEVAKQEERLFGGNMNKTAAPFAVLASLLLAVPAVPQEKSSKFAVFVTGLDEAAPVMQSIIKKIQYAKPFDLVANEDSSKVIVWISCMPRNQSEPFACMYVSHVRGSAFKTFLNAGLFVSPNADDVANNFVGSIKADIEGRFDVINKDNLKQSLEACMLLTDSQCNVPEPLQKEFGAKQLTLDQYLIKRK
jgi:hypothetical protein